MAEPESVTLSYNWPEVVAWQDFNPMLQPKRSPATVRLTGRAGESFEFVVGFTDSGHVGVESMTIGAGMGKSLDGSELRRYDINRMRAYVEDLVRHDIGVEAT